MLTFSSNTENQKYTLHNFKLKTRLCYELRAFIFYTNET